MGVVNYTYTIRDVDKLILNKIKSKNLSLRMEGMDIRLRILFSTPHEIISKRRFPCICIESGYNIRTPEMWQKEWHEYEINESNNNYIDDIFIRLIDVFYTYKIGFYVTYKSHCTYMEEQFLRMFPNDFTLCGIDATGSGFAVPFRKNGNMIELDEFNDDLKLYRRDQLVDGQILLTESEINTSIRAWEGLRVNVNDIEII